MTQTKNTQSSTSLYIAFELGSTKWVLASAANPCAKTRRKTLEAGDLAALAQGIKLEKRSQLAALDKLRSSSENALPATLKEEIRHEGTNAASGNRCAGEKALDRFLASPGV